MCIVVSRHGTWMDGRVGRARGGYLSGGCKALYDKRILAISAFAKRQTFVLRFEPGKKKSIWTLSYVNDRSKELSLAYFHDVIISFRQPIMYLWKLGKGLFCVCSGYGEFHAKKKCNISTRHFHMKALCECIYFRFLSIFPGEIVSYFCEIAFCNSIPCAYGNWTPKERVFTICIE